LLNFKIANQLATQIINYATIIPALQHTINCLQLLAKSPGAGCYARFCCYSAPDSDSAADGNACPNAHIPYGHDVIPAGSSHPKPDEYP